MATNKKAEEERKSEPLKWGGNVYKFYIETENFTPRYLADLMVHSVPLAMLLGQGKDYDREFRLMDNNDLIEIRSHDKEPYVLTIYVKDKKGDTK